MLDPWPLIGRDGELSELTVSLATAACRGVVLVGGAGVGKSRLVCEAAGSLAGSGWVVRSVTATASARAIPLSAFGRWAEDMDGASPLVLVRRLVAALGEGAEPERLLVTVDDAHLLDDLSAVVLQHLVLGGAATVLVTTRQGEPAPDAVRMLWKDGLLHRRELRPLSAGHTEDLLTAMLGSSPDPACSARMLRLAAGNALFLRQIVEFASTSGHLETVDGMVRWQVDGVAPSLVELVEAQIGAVRDAVRDVVDVVAVGEPMQGSCLQRVVEQDAIEEAEARALIRTEGDVVYMGHPVFGEVRRNTCGPWRLRRLRGQVALAMRDGAPGAAQAARRGLLWLESDLPPDVHVFLSAARAAGSLLDFGLAHRLFSAADGAGGMGSGVRSRVPLAYTLFMMSRGESADEVLDSVVAADDDEPDAYLNVVTVRAANLLWTMRSPAQSWQVVDDALATAQGSRRHNLMASRAIQLTLAARPRDVLSAMADVDYGGMDSFAATIGLAAECLAHGELGRSEDAVARAVECRRVVGLNDQGRFLGLHLAEFLTFALAAAGRIAEAVDVAEENLRAQQHLPASARVVAEEILGMALLAAGDLDAAVRRLTSHADGGLHDPATSASFPVATSVYRFRPLLAQALARSGDVAGAEATLAAAKADRHPAYVYVTSVELLAEAWVAAAGQRITEARRAARRAAEFARGHDQIAREIWCLQTAVQLGDTGCAARLGELAEVTTAPRAAVAARYAAALAADDPAGLERVSGEFEMMGDVLAAADAAGHAAVSCRRSGRTGRSLTAAARANRLGATAGGAATSPAVAAAALAVPFTNREREIALLVAQGLSNRDIAEVVSLSVRTVESHVYNASSKAGVTERAALAELVRAALG
ncbi:helix-turn-helix transcriptional regulator [Actinomycetospora atypica]|uniref:LuxR C-terminal-related transcriptional regulator n=1 Tax=Actinomycetospora atypica TaxID=1290095 RepID=A0ABV9YQ27_9PSEU